MEDLWEEVNNLLYGDRFSDELMDLLEARLKIQTPELLKQEIETKFAQEKKLKERLLTAFEVLTEE